MQMWTRFAISVRHGTHAAWMNHKQNYFESAIGDKSGADRSTIQIAHTWARLCSHVKTRGHGIAPAMNVEVAVTE